MDITAYLREKREMIEAYLETYCGSSLGQNMLSNAMAYSLLAGGKRLRPILALASYEACGGTAQRIVPYAAALEFIHTYSLIHDDLPAMDNDDLRRGKPTNHKVFGEGMAILAGDALLTEAFYLLSNYPPSLNRSTHRSLFRVIRELAMASGAHGMVVGQAADIRSESTEADSENLSFIHSHKTGALITASVRMGALLGNARKRELYRLTKYGEHIGLAFQIIDDILDIQGTSSELGKATGADLKKKKMTYPSLYGIDLSRKKAEALVRDAVACLESFSERAEPLRNIALYILERNA